MDGALNEFTPDIVVYNAGTDILDGDPLGRLSITGQVWETSLLSFAFTTCSVGAVRFSCFDYAPTPLEKGYYVLVIQSPLPLQKEMY